MATLDTLALPNTFRLPQMLRDPHQRINTTSFWAWQAVAVPAAGAGIGMSVATTPFEAMLLHHSKSLFS
jgi:hypothetical protein